MFVPEMLESQSKDQKTWIIVYLPIYTLTVKILALAVGAQGLMTFF